MTVASIVRSCRASELFDGLSPWREELNMPKYLFYGSYTEEGYRGLVEEGGSKRIEAARKALESVKGSLDAFYFSFGEEDFYILVDLPNNVTTTAVTLAGNTSGTFRIKGVPLLSPEELDEAIGKRVDFRPPGH